MKKSALVALSLVPVAIGYISNYALRIPVLGDVFFNIIPCVTLAFWFYLGRQYSGTNWNLLKSMLIGNAIGVLSLLLYVWQFLWHNDENRNLFFALLSQLFTTCTYFLTVRIAVLFEAQKNVFTRTTSTVMQILGVILMVIIFALGYAYGKKHRKESKK